MNNNDVNALLQIASALLARQADIMALADRLVGEGRTILTDAEWAQVIGEDDAATAKLVAAIKAARAGQPPPAP